MATGRIDSFYNLPELAKEQQAVTEMLNRTLELMKKLQDGLKPGAGGGTPKLPGGGGEAKKQVDALTRANLALQESLKATNLQLQAYKAQTTINNAESRQQAKALGLVGGAYDKLSGSLELAKKKYRDLAAEEKHLSAEGLTLAKNIAAMDSKIKAIDASMGNHQRNVGNYAGSFNALGTSINQLSRELPAFSVSASTGFLAISNNLPALSDAIGGIRAQNKLLAAEGKPTTSVMKQLAGAFFSWQTLLSVGITLLTVYGGKIVEFISKAIKGKDGIKSLGDELKELNNKINTESVEGAGKELGALKILRTQIESELVPREKRLQAIKDLKKEYPDYFKSLSTEEIMTGKVGNAYDLAAASILRKAKANAAATEIEKLSTENLKALLDSQLKVEETNKKIRAAQSDKDVVSVSGGTGGVGGSFGSTKEEKQRAILANFNLEKKAAQDLVDLNNKKIEFLLKFAVDGASETLKIDKETHEKQKKLIEEANSFEEERIKAIKERNKTELQMVADSQDRIAQDEKNGLSERITAIYRFGKAKEAILEINFQEEIDKLNKQRAAINEAYDKRVKDARGNQAEINEVNKQRGIELASFDAFAAEERKRIELDLQKYKIDLAYETTNRLLKIQEDFNKNLDALEEDSKKKFFKNIDDIVDDYGKKKKKQEDIDKEYARKKAELLQQLHDKEIDLTAQAIATAGDFIQGGFDRRKNAIQEEIDLITQKTAVEIEAIKNSTRTEQEKADAIATINASSQARKEALELKQRKIQEKAAKFERAFQIFQVGIETVKAVQKIQAQAAVLSSNPVTAGLAALAYAQIPLTIASGALAIGSILAKPIPKFEKGTKSSPEGFAIVGERGAEGRKNPDGTFELTPSRPTLTYLQKGTEIIPHHDLMANLPAIAMSQESNKPMTEEAYAAMMVKKIGQELGAKMDILNETVKNKKETHYSWGDDGFKASIKNGASWLEYLNRGWKD